MVAFVGSVLISIVLMAAVLVYAKRRPVGTYLSWGEAMFASTYAFFGLFWVYGVVPHQWLTYSENELGWRPDKILAGPGSTGFLTDIPVVINKQVLAHLGAVIVYGVYLVLHVALWSIWQGRGDKAERKRKALEEKTSAYGRPLVRKV